MENLPRAFVMALLELLQFLVLITVHHLTLIMKKNSFLVPANESADDINDSTGAVKNENYH